MRSVCCVTRHQVYGNFLRETNARLMEFSQVLTKREAGSPKGSWQEDRKRRDARALTTWGRSPMAPTDGAFHTRPHSAEWGERGPPSALTESRLTPHQGLMDTPTPPTSCGASRLAGQHWLTRLSPPGHHQLLPLEPSAFRKGYMMNFGIKPGFSEKKGKATHNPVCPSRC